MSVRLNVVGGALINGARIEPYMAQKGDSVKGDIGPSGWTPVLAGEADGTRTLIKVVDWLGGQGVKPQVGMYIGPANSGGYVQAKADAFNFNAAKRVFVLAAATNAQGAANFLFNAAAGINPSFTLPPIVKALPATTSVLSGPTRTAITAVTATGCTANVQQQAILTGVLSALAGATANILVIEA
ncbi:hypothetical protein NX02_19425 [Sphingomonas sanxanigenens DSM 19645 = NX02]|uniref:Uncharacterized protein n=2 Tax=Sphingomonas sanxanigenens TaxID=397260 RepID=W0AIS2_9SPHN|nr:hypothetical protein NX02_19425 [Sphingomonas sanxanigenens DSM 19645 = NX02]